MKINIENISEYNVSEKFCKLEKSLNNFCTDFLMSKSVETSSIQITNKNYILNVQNISKNNVQEKIEKALRTMAFSLDVPIKSNKGEAFVFSSQEQLTDRWNKYFSQMTRDIYNFVVNIFALPEITIMSKSESLTWKGKVIYAPETGEPVKKADWDKFTKMLEKFLSRKIQDVDKKIILESKSLGKLLDKMLKNNSLNNVAKQKLDKLKLSGKSFDWISESTKNMKSVFGDSLTRQELARIEVVKQSAGERITKVSENIKSDIKQILIDGVKNRQSKSKISQSLFDKMVGHNRDFQRIADTEIQNSVNNAFIAEEVYNAKDGEKVYFQRVEIIDDNTCKKCKEINGIIALYSNTPLSDERIKDEYANYAIWDGKDEGKVVMGVMHPYCRGIWVRWSNDDKKIKEAIASIAKKDK